VTRNRDYAKEYRDYHGKPEQIAKRGERVQARRDVIKEKGAAAVAGKDVHHKKPLRSGGGNGMSNLAITSTRHRGWNRGQ